MLTYERFSPGISPFCTECVAFSEFTRAGLQLQPVVAGAKYYEVVNTSEWDVWFGELADISAPSRRSGGGTFPPYEVAAKHATEHEHRSLMGSLVRKTGDALSWFQYGRPVAAQGTVGDYAARWIAGPSG